MSRFREGATILILMSLVVAVRLATFPHYPIPVPVIQDEAANTLGAKTFLAGRLTNPQTPFPESLMEIQTLETPTRMSKYPPAMAGFMALGEILFGNLYWGVVLCMTLAIGAGYWCLRGWVSHRSALVMCLLLLFMFRAPHYWMQSYWGGGPILLASFLIIGAYPRIVIQHRYRYVTIGLLGVVLGFLTRPFESVLLLLPMSLGFLWILLRRWSGEQRKRFLKVSILPALVILGSYGAFQLYYNYVITGDPLLMPYILHTRQNVVCPLFIFQKLNLANFSSHYILRYLQDWEIEIYYRLKTASAPLLYMMSWAFLLDGDRLTGSALIAFGMVVLFTVVLIIPIHIARQDFREKNRDYYVLHICWIVSLIGPLMASASNPHYLAPLFALYTVVWCRWWERNVPGSRLRYMSYSFLAVLFAFYIAIDSETFGDTLSPEERQAVIQQAHKEGGKHLIFVNMRPLNSMYYVHSIWVYNEPDLESSDIIWAWYMTPEENEKLIAHYKGRKLWYINPQTRVPLTPYRKVTHGTKPPV